MQGRDLRDDVGERSENTQGILDIKSCIIVIKGWLGTSNASPQGSANSVGIRFYL